jgi:hypothetical protein
MNRTAVAWCLLLALAAGAQSQSFRPDIPRAWDDREVTAFQVPLAQRDRSPQFMTSKEYYALKVRPIYRTYPMYAPGREPAGYLESLKQKEPEVVFDVLKLRTKEDWIRAGELIFASSPEPATIDAFAGLPSDLNVTTSDGIVPYSRYVIRRKGVVEVDGGNSCAFCHTRVLPDGSVLKGAQGNIPFEQAAAVLVPQIAAAAGIAPVLNIQWSFFGVPWLRTRAEFEKTFSLEEFRRRHLAMQPGVIARHGTGDVTPAKVPSLIGLENIKYLDSTGLMRHRSIGDLMRYAAANYGLDIMAHYGDFQPSPVSTGFAEAGTRFSDEQLYALALYIYSLKPPPNPNPFNEEARRGQRIFQEQFCGNCHTPPLYTSNKLAPVEGFQVPDDLQRTGDVLKVSVKTDPTLAMQTRRGTGFYKVPSLRGVWYRNAFSHSGQAETLEEWFNPERLRDDYVPKGFHLGQVRLKATNSD